MTAPHAEPAFAKVNLCLFLGPLRPDGRHELVTLFESVKLSDVLHVSEIAAGPDEVVCPGVDDPNLVAGALAALRAAGWAAPPVRVEIEKRIPVAAGMGGGSADAAAMLRYAPRLGHMPPYTLTAIAAGLGADVPGQLDPGLSLGTGAGDIVQRAADLAGHSLLVLPQPFGLGTAEVYREADRLGVSRSIGELGSVRAKLESALGAADHASPPLPEGLIVNDLQPAALLLRPEVGVAIELACEQGAEQALVCGSGPTVIGLFWGPDGLSRARRAAGKLRSRFPDAVAVGAVERGLRLGAERVIVSRIVRDC